MIIDDKHSLEQSRWSKRTGRVIEMLCFFALLAVIGTVIYGFTLRAIWAHGYWVAIAVAVLGAMVMLIGLAQQAIAARDAATWRAMAVWQVRAARQKVVGGGADAQAGSDLPDEHDRDPDSRHYYEHLVEVLLEGVQRGDEEEEVRA